MILRLWFLPVIGAVIGWVTNLLAIKLIFKPYDPVEIPVLGFKIQGLLPKRSKELAKRVGEIVEEELLPKEELEKELTGLEVKDEIKARILEVVDEKAKERIPPFIPENFQVMIIDFLKEMVKKDLDPEIENMLEKVKNKIVNETDIAQLVERQVSSFDMRELEELVLKIAAKELKHIEVLGGILGFIVGVGQALIVINL
ncbi:DUF445 family protein [Natroniella sulfidigena]|uniref:DUF445 domain-containing protein n=1 Tax=Natroniella sulfidigena TaxID=723921 RepID=UPI00200AE19B|nr:DUF445 family protein [Natroniella sulfidigena]MCK8817117.1 DUF445 family protein [Natroniella sulfidigena]